MLAGLAINIPETTLVETVEKKMVRDSNEAIRILLGRLKGLRRRRTHL